MSTVNVKLLINLRIICTICDSNKGSSYIYFNYVGHLYTKALQKV